MAAIKVYPGDRWFSKCVRERTDWHCEKCGLYFPEDQNRNGIECSHLVGRVNKSVRWCADNAFAHCTKCHFYLGGNPVEFVEWAKSQLGEGLYEIVRDKSREIYKGWKLDLPDISKHYRGEFRRMEQLRAEGMQGRIEFTSWN